MAILIVGADGSMGKRYQSILRFLKRSFFTRDLIYSEIPDSEIQEWVTGIIIATPTETHVAQLKKYMPFRKPILCEKPLTKDLNDLKDILELSQETKSSLQMMYQYKQLIPKYATGESYYNYFKHGNDGLIWDCLQIIGLSKDKPTLKEESPIWNCMINGHRLRLDQMDEAYVKAVEAWLYGHPQDLGEIKAIHQKTWEMAYGQ